MASIVRTLGLSATARVFTLPFTAVATILTTYLLVRELGLESYGYIVLVGALFQLIPFADLGLGAAVVNASSKRLESRELSARALATAGATFRVLALSALVIVAAVFLVGNLEAWPSLLGLPDSLATSASWAIGIVILPFALSLPFGIGQRILIGEGRNHIVGYIGILGPLTATATTYVLLKLGVDPLVLGIATPTGILIVSLVCFVLALKTSGWRMRDLLRVRKGRSKPKLWNSALPMMVISITVPLALQSDRLILSHLSQTIELSEYSIAAQMYVPCFSIISMAAVALWPIFSRSGAASLSLWSKAFSSLTGAGGVLAVIFIFLVGPVSKLVTEGRLAVHMDLALAFGTLLVVMACHQASAVLLTSPSHLAFQAGCSTAMLLVNLGLSLLMAPALGASGVVWASAIAVFITQLVPCIYKAQKFMRSTTVEVNSWV
ncbi:MATE family efflux transporter [Pseudarthrobacter oxydans]|uniref:hypothetical protein n=1 Tax=Pseudarthrobacter oxydans TaxID=1671 RepID=UPI003800A8C9